MKNFKFKGVVAAVAMAVSSGASAVILPTLDGSGSSLVLTAYDNTSSFLLSDGVTTETASRGIVVDLGFTLSQYMASPGTAFSATNVSTLFQDTFFNALNSDGNVAASNANNIRWNVTAGDWGVDLASRQVLLSRSTGLGAPTLTNGQLDNSVGTLNSFFGNINNDASCSGGSCGFTVAATSFAGVNPASNWKQNFNGQNANDNTAGLGGSIEMYLSQSTTQFVFGSVSIVPGNQSLVSGPFATNFTLDSTGNFAAVSAVPVPAAVWLFGSGLMGMVSVGRRRAAA